MRLQVPQSSQFYRVIIEITGPDILRRIEASTEVAEVTPRLPEGTDERLVAAKAWFINGAREPVGEEIVLKEAEDVESEVSEEEAPEEVDEPWEGEGVSTLSSARRVEDGLAHGDDIVDSGWSAEPIAH
jgi:hypothetical protein